MEEKEEIKQFLINKIREEQFSELVKSLDPVLAFKITGFLITSKSFSVNLREELAKSKENFDYEDEAVVSLMASICLGAWMNMRDLIATKLENYSGKERDVEKIVSSSQITEQITRYINIELNPYVYVLTHRVVEEAMKFERLRKLIDFIDDYDKFYGLFRDLLASLNIGRKAYVHNVINSITFTDPELKKALLGED